MFRIDSKHFPCLKRGHSNINMKIAVINEKPRLVCSAEGCKGEDTHQFGTTYDAAKKWAEERGLKVSVNVLIN